VSRLCNIIRLWQVVAHPRCPPHSRIATDSSDCATDQKAISGDRTVHLGNILADRDNGSARTFSTGCYSYTSLLPKHRISKISNSVIGTAHIRTVLPLTESNLFKNSFLNRCFFCILLHYTVCFFISFLLASYVF